MATSRSPAPPSNLTEAFFGWVNGKAASGRVPFLELAAWTLAAVYAITAVAHAGGGGTRTPAIVGLSAGLALLMAGLAVAAGRSNGEFPRLGLATGVAGLVLANALVRLGLHPSPEQTTHLVLALVGVGVFVHVRTYLLLSAVAWAGWVLAIPSGASAAGWGQQAWFLLMATGLGAVLMLARLYQDHERERAGLVEEGLSQDLAVSLGWYRTLFHESPALMCIHDAAGRIEEVNPAGLQALGYDRAHVVGSNILEFMIPVSPDGPSEYLEDVVSQGRAEGFLRARRSDGKVRIWEYRSTRLQSGSDVQVLATATDVTDLDRARGAVARLVCDPEVPEGAPSTA